MQVEPFFYLLLEELKSKPKLREYYKFLDDPAKLPFRQAYYCQRLQYISDHLHQIAKSPNHQITVWDCGCGYATTQIFLALNGIASQGTTLEFYFREIPDRLKYWEQFGDMSLVKVSYEDVFESQLPENSVDVILVQDTLHHLEPLQQSLAIFHRTLRPGGKLIAIEENGNNLVQRLKLYRQRGNRRIIQFYDEGLGRMVTMGNENIRPYSKWKAELAQAGFAMDEESLQYVRFFPPSFFENRTWQEVAAKEQALWKMYPLLREYFFFGVNFTASKV